MFDETCMSYYIDFVEYPNLYRKFRELYNREGFGHESFGIWLNRNYGCTITSNYVSYSLESLIFNSEQDAFLFLMNHV